MDVPDDANTHCPGTKSESAGKSSACAGCPNQSFCSSGQGKQVDPAIQQIKESMKVVKHKIVVLSGKGGVGKSTFTSQLALALALPQDVINSPSSSSVVATNTTEEALSDYNRDSIQEDKMDIQNSEDYATQVGVLDVDLCGPSIPKMFGLEGSSLHQSNLGWSPVYYEDNLAVVSIGFMLPNKDDAVIWRGPKKNGLIKQFLRDVYWGDYLDYLIIDTPPGTSDEHITIVQYLKEADLDGAIIVTTPQEVACLDVRKEINFCKKVGIPIIGIVENMSGFVCPNCKNETKIFRPTTGGGEALAKQFDLKFLGRIPLDPNVMNSCENGKSIIKEHPNSPASISLKSITQQLRIPSK